jgi:lipopolysaccharide/colanic/teichoic acid biosynthesis glycosyltransferase
VASTPTGKLTKNTIPNDRCLNDLSPRTDAMSTDQASTWKDIAAREKPLVRRSRIPKVARYLLYSTFGTSVAVAVPMLLAVFGIGMSRQQGDVVLNAAFASLVAIFVGFLIIRRLFNLPLLRTYGYVALTFLGSFLVVAVALKFLRINFSSPQLFLGFAIITALIEVFFYARRHGTPQDIAVVPGAATLIKLPKRTLGPIKFTPLTAAPSGQLDYHGVIADFSADLEPAWERFLAMAALEGIPVLDVRDFNESLTGRVAVEHLRENTFGGLIPSLIYPQFKFALDFLAALLVLPLIASIIFISAIFIKLETRGPIFFRQLRTGLGGRPFTIIKLRTMTHNHNGDAYTRLADDRITRVGRVLRQYRIDELPQTINVLRGEMSWIGPRPEAISLAEWYEREVPFYVYRHVVRPGLSGWAQVHQGNVAEVDAARLKLEYDFFYIKNFSFWLDAVIAIKTLRAIVMRFGSR